MILEETFSRSDGGGESWHVEKKQRTSFRMEICGIRGNYFLCNQKDNREESMSKAMEMKDHSLGGRLKQGFHLIHSERNWRLYYCFYESNLTYYVDEKIFCGEKVETIRLLQGEERFANGEKGGLGNARWQSGWGRGRGAVQILWWVGLIMTELPMCNVIPSLRPYLLPPLIQLSVRIRVAFLCATRSDLCFKVVLFYLD